MNVALCVGINNYPGESNDLKGCVNDANDWAHLLAGLDFNVTVLLDSLATRKNILEWLANMIYIAEPGDNIVFTYSGHGTSVCDRDGDEVDGYDEALYVYDGRLLDDELRCKFSCLQAGVSMTVILDSCYSGTATRLIANDRGLPRYIETDRVHGVKLNKRMLVDESMPEILISGSSDSEYSWDAFINGRYNGAFTNHALSVYEPGMTYNEFYDALRELLPSRDYPQTPQLDGSDENKNRVMFGVEPAEAEQPVEPYPPKPIHKSVWWVVALIVGVGVIVGLLL